MTTRPPKHGGHARRRWQTRTQPQPDNVVDLARAREVKNSYWIGWADCYQQIQEAQGGAL